MKNEQGQSSCKLINLRERKRSKQQSGIKREGGNSEQNCSCSLMSRMRWLAKLLIHACVVVLGSRTRTCVFSSVLSASKKGVAFEHLQHAG